MKIASYLDFNLQKYTERLALVEFLISQGKMDHCPPSELDKVANYLLYAEDVDAEVELKEGSKKKVSYETLIETTLGENTVQHHEEVSIYRIPRPSIDRVKDADIPGMKDLWEAIDLIDERYRYCKDVLEGKRDMDLERELIPTYQTKYFMREWMIDLRREQFLLKDIFRPVVCNAPIFHNYACRPDTFGMKIGPHSLCDSALSVDYGKWQDVYAMLKYYNGMKARAGDDPYNEWWVPYEFLDELINRIHWSKEHEIILWRKIDRVPNEDIVKELSELGHKAYSVNYISTIWKQHLSKRIVKEAYLWWEEHTHQPNGLLRNMTKWKICDTCGEQLYADEINFGKYQDGTWKETCKHCAYLKKVGKDKGGKK